MTDFLMPDSEAIVSEALRAAFPGIHTAVYLPVDWQLRLRAQDRLLVVRRVGGKDRIERYLDSGIFNVQTYATSRRDASLFARQARAELISATRARFVGDEGRGHLHAFREMTGPFMTTDPMTEAQPDFYRFTANYVIDTRPRR